MFHIIALGTQQEVQEVMLRANREINFVPCGRNWPLMKSLRDILESDH